MAELPRTFTQAAEQIATAYRNIEAKQKQASEIGDENSVMKLGSQLDALRSELVNLQGQKAQRDQILDQELASGEFWMKYPKEKEQPTFSMMGGVPVVSGPSKKKENEYKDAVLSTMAQRYETDPASIDVESGIPNEFRRKLSLLPNLQDKDEFLRSKYGDENVDLKNIAGDSAFFIRTGGKYVMVDELGFSGKDLLDVVGEVIPTAATIGAALATRSPQGGQAGAQLVRQAVVSNAVGQAAGAVQDATAEAFLLGDPDKIASLESIKPGEILTRRGIQAIQGAVLDYGIGKTIQMIGKKSLPGIARKSAEEEIAAVQRLQKRGLDVTESPGAFMAEGGIEKLQRRAMQPGGGPLRERLSRNLDATEAFKRAAEGGDPNKPVVLDSIFNGFIQRINSVARNVQSMDRRVNAVLEGSAQNRARSIQINRNTMQIGQDIIDLTKQLEKKQDGLKRKMYESVWADANAQGVAVPKIEVLQTLEKAMSDPRYKFYDPGVAKKIANTIRTEISKANAGKDAAKRATDIRLRWSQGKATKSEIDSLPALDALAAEAQSLSANYPLQAVDNITKAIKESVPANGTVATGNTSAVIADFIDDKVDELLVNKMTPELEFRYLAARKNYRENRIPFETDIGGLILRSDKGRSVTTPKQALDNLFADPSNPDRFINLVRGTDPKAVPNAVQQLQEGYLAHLGGIQGREIPQGGLAYNEDVVMSVFGRKPDGTPDPVRGRAMKVALDELNASLKAKGLSFGKITDTKNSREVLIDDIAKLPDNLDQQTRRRAIKALTERAEALDKANKIFDNKVLETVYKQKGLGNTVSNEDFANAMFSANPAKIRETLRAMSPDEATRSRTAMVRWLFKEYPPTFEKTQRTGIGLWDPDKFLRDYAGNTGLRQRMEAALGTEFTKDFHAASTVLRSSRMAPIPSTASLLRGTGGIGKFSLYLAGKIDDYAINPVLAAAYGSNRLQPFLRFLAKNPDPAQVARQADAVMKSTISSTKGMGLLMDIASDDADTASWLMDSIGASAQAERDMLQKYKVQQQ